jgi:hypothetical protein
MKQILHIFAKDVRHFRIEILVLLAAIAAQICIAPHLWPASRGNSGFNPEAQMTQVSGLLAILMVVTWGLLVSRVVHDERLVGDRQLWLTRPYEWKKLLAAKFLFLAVIVCLPFLLLQCTLLAEAGFSPLHWTPRLLLSLLPVTAYIILPLMAVAAISSSFGRMVLILLGVIVCFLLFLTFVAVWGTSSNPNSIPATPLQSWLSIAFTLLVCGEVITLQYAKRREWRSRLFLVALPAGLILISLVAPDRLLMSRIYPPASSANPAAVQASIASLNFLPGNGQVSLSIPLHISGIKQSSAIVIDSAQLTLEAPGGARWTSPWVSGPGAAFLPDADYAQVNMLMPRSVYDKFAPTWTTARLKLAMTETHIDNVTQVALPQPMHEFAVPGFGICTPQDNFSGDAKHISCRFAYYAPLTYVSTHWHNEPCSISQDQSEPGVVGAAWAGKLDHSVSELTLFPIVTPFFQLTNGMVVSPSGGIWRPRNLCPGTPVTFTRYAAVRRFQTELSLQSCQPPAAKPATRTAPPSQ